ncbi:hypothetical protein OAU50_07685, partial [Planctomycetota bacterium]|nr:hypothetical protein [Planctomycetota bacterium]
MNEEDKKNWDKINTGPDWHPAERPNPPLINEEDFPDNATFTGPSNDHPVPSKLVYTGKMGPLPDPEKPPEPLEKILADAHMDALESIQSALKFNRSTVDLAQGVLDGKDVP